jgi:hypothetical protein
MASTWATTEIVPIGLDNANAFVKQHHSYMANVHRCKFCLALTIAGDVAAVLIANVPSSTHYDDGRTLELLRVCIGAPWPHLASKLIGRACRAAKALGYNRVITWCDDAKEGTSYHAANFYLVKVTDRSHWRTRPAKRDSEPSSQLKLFAWPRDKRLKSQKR